MNSPFGGTSTTPHSHYTTTPLSKQQQLQQQQQQQQDNNSSTISNNTPQHHRNNGNDGGADSSRERSQTDTALLNFKHLFSNANHNQHQSVGMPPDSPHSFKQKLHELFSLIEREMETLHLENRALRARLEENGQPAGENKIIIPNEIETTPKRTNFPFPVQSNEMLRFQHQLSSEPEQKSDAKKSIQSRQQKWKSAFKNPSGKLALKVGANFPESKHRFVQSFNGHVDGVWHVCAAKIGMAYVLGSASADQTAKIWLADQSSQPIANYSGHSGSVNSISIHPNDFLGYSGAYDSNLTLLTCSGDRTAHIWRINLEQIMEKRKDKMVAIGGQPQTDDELPVQQVHQPLLKLTGHTDAITAGNWLFGGEQVITVSWDRTAKLFDVETGKNLKVLSGHDQELTSCSAHPIQKLLATASRDFTFRLWDFREPIHSVAVFQGHNDAVTSVGFTTLHHIISGSDDRTVKVWDLRNMRSPISAIRLDSAANRIAICNTKNLLAIPLDNRNIFVYDLNGNRQARIPRSTGKSHHRLVTGCTWICDHPINNLITCGFDKKIIGWRVHLPGGTTTAVGGKSG